MNTQYKYSGQPLTSSIAQELIQELFAGQTVKKQEILRAVDETHRERGGLPPKVRSRNPIAHTLSRMKQSGLAENPKRGFWLVLSKESHQSEEPSQIKTLNQFMEWVQQLPPGEYVYRGVSSEKYPIEASTYRRLKDEKGKFRNKEDQSPEKLLAINEEMIEDANRHRHGWKNEQPLSDLNLLAELQHRGAATCLIDFTTNPQVALWMACRDSSHGSAKGKVYAVDISSHFTYKPVDTDLARREKIAYFFTRDERKGHQLYQWQPNYQNNRMLAQQSIFLFGGGVGAIKASEKCVISADSKQDISTALAKSAGITEDILFPDFEGFASQRAQNKKYIIPDARHYLNRASDAYLDGNTNDAIGYCTQGIALQPQDDNLLVLLYIRRADLYERNGKHDLAVKDYNEVICLKPDHAQAYFNRGTAKYAVGRYEEAISDYSEVIRLEPDNAAALNNRGNVRYTVGQYEGAIADYNESIRLDPNDASTYYNRGNIKSELKRYEEALTDYNESIRLKPDNASVYSKRGNVNYDVGQYEEAIADYNESIRLEPNDAFIYNNRGATKFELGRYEDAIADYDAAIRLNPNNATAYNSRGYVKSMQGNHEDAIADYDESIRLDPNNAFIYNNRGATKFELGRYEDAIVDYDESIRLNPNDATAYINRGYAKSRIGHYDDAVVDCDKTIRLNPNDASAYNLRGVVKSKLKRYEDAIVDYDESIRLNPNDASAYNNRGRTKFELGRYEDAISDYDAAIRLNPDDATLYQLRGDAKFGLGKNKEAFADYEEANRLSPGTVLVIPPDSQTEN